MGVHLYDAGRGASVYLNGMGAADPVGELGVAGRWAASVDEGSFSENSLHQLGLSADVLLKGVRPGISVRIPLDEEYRDLVKSSVGLYLQVSVR